MKAHKHFSVNFKQKLFVLIILMGSIFSAQAQKENMFAIKAGVSIPASDDFVGMNAGGVFGLAYRVDIKNHFGLDLGVDGHFNPARPLLSSQTIYGFQIPVHMAASYYIPVNTGALIFNLGANFHPVIFTDFEDAIWGYTMGLYISTQYRITEHFLFYLDFLPVRKIPFQIDMVAYDGSNTQRMSFTYHMKLSVIALGLGISL